MGDEDLLQVAHALRAISPKGYQLNSVLLLHIAIQYLKVNGLKNDDPKAAQKCPVLTDDDLGILRKIIEEHE